MSVPNFPIKERETHTNILVLTLSKYVHKVLLQDNYYVSCLS